MKLLLYCTKAKPKLYNTDKGFVLTDFKLGEYFNNKVLLNGKIVAECDYEVEEITSEKLDTGVGYEPIFYTETIDDISKESCLTQFEIENYLGCKAGGEVVGYAIHIKNLNIFDKPRDTREYNTYNRYGKVHIADIPIRKAPQNMMYAFDYYGNPFVLISIKPEWLCKILNGEKTIEVRRKVLKEMK